MAQRFYWSLFMNQTIHISFFENILNVNNDFLSYLLAFVLFLISHEKNMGHDECSFFMIIHMFNGGGFLYCPRECMVTRPWWKMFIMWRLWYKDWLTVYIMNGPPQVNTSEYLFPKLVSCHHVCIFGQSTTVCCNKVC